MMKKNDNKKSFFKTLPGILTGLAALIASLTGLYLAFQGSRPPEDSTQPTPQVQQQKQQAIELFEEFMIAWQKSDHSAISAMSDTPYYFFDEIMIRREKIFNKWKLVFSQKNANFQMETMKTKTIAELKEEGIDRERGKIIESLHLSDEDIAIELTASLLDYQAIITLFTRRADSELKLAGIHAPD